jgi:enoyl-CoA hydratase/carnithine racemase
MLVSTETLHLEYLDGKTIAVVTLDDPARANAMSAEMGDAFSRAVREIQSESDVRAIVIRGAGNDFSIRYRAPAECPAHGLAKSRLDEKRLRTS